RLLGRSDNGRIVAIGRNEAVFLWVRDKPEQLRRVVFADVRERRERERGGRGGIAPRIVTATPDLRRLFSLDVDGRLNAWELEESNERLQASHIDWKRGYLNNVSTIAQSPDGNQLAIGGRDGSVRFLNGEDG